MSERRVPFGAYERFRYSQLSAMQTASEGAPDYEVLLHDHEKVFEMINYEYNTAMGNELEFAFNQRLMQINTPLSRALLLYLTG